jgi:hypothetical protein
MDDANTEKALEMRYINVLILVILSCCSLDNLNKDTVKGKYVYSNNDSFMVLDIKSGNKFLWSIKQNGKVLKSQAGEWEGYDLGGKNPRLIIKGFCFPPGVSRAGICTNEYPAIIKRTFFSGQIIIPIDTDISESALIKT